MKEYRKKPVVIGVVTFDELVAYGKEHADNIVEGMPWSFEFEGVQITHENDECYVIPTLEGNHNFTPKDVLIKGIKGELYPCKIDIFKATYDEVDVLNVDTSPGPYGGLHLGRGTFGEATRALNAGLRVARSGWNGNDMFVFQQVPSEIPLDVIANMQSLPQSVKDEFAKRGASISYRNQLAIVKPNNEINGWTPSGSDALATDWKVLD